MLHRSTATKMDGVLQLQTVKFDLHSPRPDGQETGPTADRRSDREDAVTALGPSVGNMAVFKVHRTDARACAQEKQANVAAAGSKW